MKKAFIFDMDGTLMDNIPFHERAWMAFLKNHGFDMSEEEMIAKAYGTGRDAMRRFFGQLTDNEADTLIEEKEVLYKNLYRPQLAHRPGLSVFLEKTRAHGLRIALGTAGDMGNVDFAIDGLGLRHFFEKIVSAEDVAHGKPNPEVFLKAAEKLGIAPEHCVVFEDSESGLEAAHRAGMAAVAVSTSGFFEKTDRWPGLLGILSDFHSEPEIFMHMTDPQHFLQVEMPALLATLPADRQPKWGKMTAQHMVEHISGTMLISNGKFPWPGPAGTEWGLANRHRMLEPGFSDYPKNLRVPGVPEVPATLRFPDIETAKGRFLGEVARFFTYFSENPQARPVNPLFGEMDFGEWKTVHTFHFQHHFRQFGLLPE